MTKEPIKLPHGEKFRDAWEEWVEYRRVERKKPLGPFSIKRQLKILTEISEENAIATIDKAINSGWQGLFPDKNLTPPKNNLWV